MKVLWGTKPGAEFWQEDILTTKEDRFQAATAWAREKGFTNIRISDDDDPPDFAKCVKV
jgi:hypothetical protein